MACFYDMKELELPFEHVQLTGCKDKFDRVEKKDLFPSGPLMEIDHFVTDPEAKERTFGFFNLLVCKDCRADWMGTIQEWFKNIDVQPDGIPGLYVRDKGATRLMTEDEMAARFTKND